jgi:hypothetical protein
MKERIVTKPEERLEAEDPFAASDYLHPDFEGMLSRVTQTRGASNQIRSRTTLVILAAAAVVVGLVVAGMYGWSSSTSGASVLIIGGRIVNQTAVALPSPQRAPTEYVPAGFTDGALAYDIRPATPEVLGAGRSLSSTSHSGLAYELATPADGAGFISRVASTFGVKGSPRGRNGTRPYWVVGSFPNPEVVFRMQGSLPTYQYSSGPCEVYTTVVQLGARLCPKHPGRPHGGELSQVNDNLTKARMVALASRYVQDVGLGYKIGAPIFSPRFTEPTYSVCRHACVFVSVSFPVVIHGDQTPAGFGITFDQRGTVISASGSAYRILPYKSYPLLSEVGGVSAINATHPFDAGGEFASSGRPHCSPKPCRFRRVSALPPVHVTLDSVSEYYDAYVLHDGTLVLLPVYLYTQSSGNVYPPTFSMLAVNPSDIQYKSLFNN